MEEMFACVASPVSAELYPNQLSRYLTSVLFNGQSLVVMSQFWSTGLVGANMYQTTRTDSSCMIFAAEYLDAVFTQSRHLRPHVPTPFEVVWWWLLFVMLDGPGRATC